MSGTIPTSTLEKFTTFGDLLRYLRRRSGLTQLQLSIAVNYSDTQISRLEQNLRLPDLTTIEARFVSALELEDEPKAVARLLDLAANTRREDVPAFGISPYKGLSYFDESDADMFAGRETLTAKLTERILALLSSKPPDEMRFLAIVGASGSGKSSLVRAGLVPALRWNKKSADWPIYTLTPTAHPLESLAASLADSVAATESLMDDLARDPRSLQIYIKRILQPANASQLLLIIDQFEELFALCHSEDERTSLINNLLVASSEPGGPTIVVITLRADFYAHCAGYYHLREALAQHQEYIGAMTDEELQRAIEEPARRGRWELEPGLADLLLHDVGHEPGALPLLSHALFETWQRRRGRMMTLGGYASSGGVRGAIAETAEAVFNDHLTPQQQVLARRIFLRLTELGDETSTGDTRRRATIEELILKPEEAESTRVVLKALADARLITMSRDAAEVAHEALIREWPTLRGWLEDNRDSIRLHRQLTDASLEWSAANHEADLLYRGARLTQASEWAATHSEEMNDLEREFLTASIESSEREAAEREAQRQRELVAAQMLAEAERVRAEENLQSANRLQVRNRVITVIGAFALVLAVLAGIFGVLSNRNAKVAQANSARAESMRLAGVANVLLLQNGDPEIAALLSIRALRSSYSIQADANLAESLDHLYNRQLFSGHTGSIYSVAFSPDGKYILTGSQDGTARLWDVQKGEEVRRFIVHKGGVSAVAFSPDGKLVVTGGNDGTVRLWDDKSGDEIKEFTGHANGVSAVAFSHNGKYLLTAGGDNTARLWDVETGELLQSFTGHSSFVSDVAFSPDDGYVLTGSFDTTARVWETTTGKELHAFTGHTQYSSVTSAAFSPDGKYVLTGNRDHTAQLWEVETGVEIRTFSDHTDSVNDVAFSPDGQYVLTGSEDKTVRLWNIQSGQEVRQFIGHQAGVKAVGFSPDGQYVLSGGEDNTARLWAATSNASPRIFSGHTLGVTSVTFSPDGRYALTGSQDATARLWDIASGREIRSFIGHTKAINSVAISPDGRYALTGSDDNTARLWNVETGQEVRVLTGHSIAGVVNVAFSPDNKYALTIGAGNTTNVQFMGETLLWDIQSGRIVRDFNIGPGLVGDNGYGIGFSPDNKYVFTGPYLSDLETGKLIKTFNAFAVHSLTISPDGKYVLTGDDDKTVRLWDAATGDLLRTFTQQVARGRSVAFSPDGKFALAGLDNNLAYLWDVGTGQQLRQFYGHSGRVDSVAFSPDGKYILTGSTDGTARLWDTDYHDTIRFACSLLWRDFTNEERTLYNLSDSMPTCPKP
jgi:WD40 repeat protein